VLQVCTCILARQTTDWFSYTIIIRLVHSSKFLAPMLTVGPMGTLATAGVE
jgi:hypothetical protein